MTITITDENPIKIITGTMIQTTASTDLDSEVIVAPSVISRSINQHIIYRSPILILVMITVLS